MGTRDFFPTVWRWDPAVFFRRVPRLFHGGKSAIFFLRALGSRRDGRLTSLKVWCTVGLWHSGYGTLPSAHGMSWHRWGTNTINTGIGKEQARRMYLCVGGQSSGPQSNRGRRTVVIFVY